MKSVEEIILEMIQLVTRQGHDPLQINLTQEYHDALAEELGMYDDLGYKIEDYGVIYRPKKKYKDILEYKGIPVNITKDFISVTWV